LGKGGIALSFVGDGGANQGTFLESLNLASVWKLPCLFVVENNGYAEATSVKYAGACHDFADRANGFGMPGVTVDGHDFFAVFETANEAIMRARSGGGPSLIECKVNRYYGHYEGDTQSYRGPNEVENIRASRDCIQRFAAKAVASGLVKQADLDNISHESADAIDQAVSKAKSAPKPALADLLTDVYISY
jgi:pyruvate dehydrogenase E1 component alpha subunit